MGRGPDGASVGSIPARHVGLKEELSFLRTKMRELGLAIWPGRQDLDVLK